MVDQPDDRIPTAVWVDAHLRKFHSEGKSCYIVNKGAYAAGTVLLKINTLGQGCLILQQQRDINGVLGWMRLLKGEAVAEPQADEYIRKAIDRDPDIWAIEVEDRAAQNPFEGKIF